jgi:putative Mg2+ transporter-C (MgtC) family protein
MHAIDLRTFLFRLTVATLLGFLIGLEREWRQRSAGLHTAVLVAAGASIFASLPELVGISDALRVAGQIITGVGFLAGGVIVREGMNVRGLITAATLWATAAVGTLAGIGLEEQAALGAVFIFSTNVICWPLAGAIARIPRSAGEQLLTTYTIHVECAPAARQVVRDAILAETAKTSSNLLAVTSSTPTDGVIHLRAEIGKPGRDDGFADRLDAQLAHVTGVASVVWEASERTV